MTREELIQSVKNDLADAERYAQTSFWFLERCSRVNAEQVALHLLLPEEYPLPAKFQVRDWVAVGWDPHTNTPMSRVLPATTYAEAKAAIEGQADWWAVIPHTSSEDAG